jgi:hypothetical protein
MKQKILNLELILNLTEDSKREIALQNNWLKEKAGAIFEIDDVTSTSVQVSVRNINGKRWSKYDLLTQTYQVFSKNLPQEYRILIKL